jgi:hypothetical protein
VIATLVGEQWRVATLGTADERAALVDVITNAVGRNTTSIDVARRRETPASFTATESAGELRLLRHVRAWPLVLVMVPIAICFVLPLLFAARLGELDIVSINAAIGGAAILLALVGARRRELGFIVRQGSLRERRGLLLVRERPLSTDLVVRRHVDGDNDERFELCADGRVLLGNASAAPCLHLGHFLAARIGTRLREEDA